MRKKKTNILIFVLCFVDYLMEFAITTVQCNLIAEEHSTPSLLNLKSG